MSTPKRLSTMFTVMTLVLLGVVCSALAQVESKAGTWKTHVLTSGSALRLPPPPNPSATQAELADLRALAAQRDASALDQISYWDAGWPGYRWMELGMSSGLKRFSTIGPFGNYRLVTLLGVAMYDATVAAWDSKYAHNRPRSGGEGRRAGQARPVRPDGRCADSDRPRQMGGEKPECAKGRELADLARALERAA